MVVAVTQTHKPALLKAVACERQGVYSVDSRRKRWDRKDRNDIDVKVCVCLFICLYYAHGFDCFFILFFLPVCSFICPSVCISVNLTVCSVHLCWIWTASAECFLCRVCFPLLWLGKCSSVWIWVPALWSQIIPNTVKSAKHAPKVDTNHLHDPV